MRLHKLLTALAPLLAACGRSAGDVRAPDSSTVAVSRLVPVGSASGASSTGKSACPRTGQWATCSVEQRLVRSGFVVRPIKGKPERRPGFSVSPSVYQLGKSHLEVFLYATPNAAAKDAAGLDTVTASPRGSRGAWNFPVTFVRSANLIAILLTPSPVQADRLSLALTAGAPQP